MKRIFTFLLIVFACITVNAESVSEQQAFQKAQQFMKGKQLASPHKSQTRALLKETVAHGYYVFNTVESNGFVVIASDDKMPEVLGYSEHGSLDPKTAPCNVKWLLEYYDKVFANIRQTGAKTRAVTRAAKPDVRPLITTTWDQGAPYNSQCPEYNGTKCITGCVATAMAQVINYNRWPQGMTSIVPSYTTEGSAITLPELEPTLFNWDNMTNDDIARLMRYCGQSVEMNYGTIDSGAYPEKEPQALINIFGYSQTAHFVAHSSYSDEEWEDLLYNELAESRPIVFNGYGGGGGHTFVVHGYADGRFYINWGWSGNEDGYFVLTNLNTNEGSYSSDQSATIGIQPPAGNIVGRPQVVIRNILSNQGKFTSRDTEGCIKDIAAKATLVSDLSEPKTIRIGLGLYNADGLTKVLYEEEHEFSVGEEYIMESSFDIKKEIPNGIYRVAAIHKPLSSDEWMSAANSSDYYLEILLDDERMRLRNYPLSEDERKISDEAVVVIDGLTYLVYSSGSGRRARIMDDKAHKPSGDVYIPDSVEYNGNLYHVYDTDWETFWECSELTSLSTAVTRFPGIDNAPKLKKLELREGVTTLADNCINRCNELDSIVFPQSLRSVAQMAGGCNNLKYIRFKNTSEFNLIFWDPITEFSLPSLKDIYFASSEPPILIIKCNEFSINQKIKIHVPIGAKSSYESEGWSGWNIVEDLPAPNNNGFRMGYIEGMETEDGGWNYDAGSNDSELAIRLPAEMLKPYIGNTISKIKYHNVYEKPKYVFITKTGVDYLVKQPFLSDDLVWDEVELADPCVITGEDLYVGVGAHESVCMFPAKDAQPTSDGFWHRVMGIDTSGDMQPGEWINVSEENGLAPIPLMVYISGDNIPDDIALSNVSIQGKENGKYTIQGKATSHSLDIVKNFTLSWDIDGKISGNEVIEAKLRTNKSAIFEFEVSADISGKNHTFNYDLTTVNGKEDAVDANSKGAVAFLATSSTYFPRKIVMEEATGTWCGWCVYGIETIERLKKEYPDNFIAIGLHSEDAMDNIEGYREITDKFTSYPSCLVNRTQMLSPSYPDIKPLIEEMKDNGMARITISASYANAEKTSIKVLSESEFGFNEQEGADYRVAYVVLEDHVGPYIQTNYFSGNVPSPDSEWMEEWMKKDAKVKIEYFDVARGIYGGTNGIKGSVPETIQEGTTYKHEYSINLPRNVQNKENISIVALLIDNKIGEILNADLFQLGEGNNPNETQAKTFEFRYKGKPLEDNATVVIDAEEDNFGFGEMNCETNPSINPTNGLVLATLGDENSGTAKLEILSNTLDPDMIQWCMGGECVPMNNRTSLEKSFIADNDGICQVQFDANNVKSEGTLVAKLTVTIGNETRVVNINFVYNKVHPIDKVEFRYNGKSVDDNSTVTINAEEDGFGFGEMNCETNPSSNPKNGLVFVTPDGVQDGTAKIEILSNTLNPGMIQWCMGGDCVPLNNRTSFEKSFKTGSDGMVLVQFDANNIRSEGTLEAKLAATISNETRTVNIKFVYDKTNGINAIYSDDDNAVWYDLKGNRLESTPTRKAVYIRNGKKVVR